jgi:beta-glucosidase
MDYGKKIADALSRMTLDEKSELCMGKDDWCTRDFPHLGIPSVMMSDGTNGVRFNKSDSEIRQDIGDDAEYTFFDVTVLSQNSDKLNYIHPATCFPSGSAIASSWDRHLVRDIAAAVAGECKKNKLSLLLGPAMNIRRSPLGGRSFEYFSEDPALSGEVAAAYVKGLQENGVGATLKHFSCNNSETQRTKSDSVVEERALREIFLAGFERAVAAKPWAVMSSYNLLNGVQMAENKGLLTDILRKEWGFEGFVVSDWWGIKDRVAAALAGNDMEMPFNSFDLHILSDAVRAGKLDQARLDRLCENILAFVFRASDAVREKFAVDYPAHHRIARRALEESMVLLKNEDSCLPIDPVKTPRILVAGSIAKSARYQGGGCALVNPTFLDVPFDEIVRRAAGAQVDYAPGYDDDDATTDAMIAEAVRKAKNSDTVILFAGLAVSTDIEGSDRATLDIEPSHVRLIEEISRVNKRVAVVLSNGAEVVMPWIDKAQAVLETFMCGQAGGSAVAKVLFGEVNPSGKLTVTFPKRIEDLAAYPEFPGENSRNVYTEGIYVGYRYFDVKKIEPLFPFGHGLSYTSFEYKNLKLSKQSITGKETLTASFTVANTGNVFGKEIAQLYVAPPPCRLRRPPKELKGFEKIALEPGESKEVAIELSGRDFSYYDPEFGAWVADQGAYKILVGKSSQDICLTGIVTINAVEERHVKVKADTIHAELFKDEKATQRYFRWLVDQGVFTADQIDGKLKTALTQSFVGLYNTLPTYSKRIIGKEDFQKFLDDLNASLGRGD